MSGSRHRCWRRAGRTRCLVEPTSPVRLMGLVWFGLIVVMTMTGWPTSRPSLWLLAFEYVTVFGSGAMLWLRGTGRVSASCGCPRCARSLAGRRGSDVAATVLGAWARRHQARRLLWFPRPEPLTAVVRLHPDQVDPWWRESDDEAREAVWANRVLQIWFGERELTAAVTTTQAATLTRAAEIAGWRVECCAYRGETQLALVCGPLAALPLDEAARVADAAVA